MKFRSALLLLILICPALVNADQLNSFSTQFPTSAVSEVNKISHQLTHGLTPSLVRFSLEVQPLGRVQFEFSRFSAKDWSTHITSAAADRVNHKQDMLFLRGHVYGRSFDSTQRSTDRLQKQALSASIEFPPTGLPVFSAYFLAKERVAVRAYRVEAQLTNSGAAINARVRRAPSFAMLGKKCAAHGFMQSLDALTSSAAVSTKAASTWKQVDIITDCDSECYSALGATANNTIASYLNTVSSIYEDELNMTFKLVKQYARTDHVLYPASLTDANELLDQFTTVAPSLGSADVKHLVTGRNLDGSTVGLGYSACTLNLAGVVCYCPDYSLALSETFSSLFTPIIMAHEIGHNFGASHDPASSGIMAAMLTNPPASTFSNFSLNEINSFVSAHGTCLTSVPSGSSSSASSSSSNSSSSSSSTPNGGGNVGDTPGKTYADISASFKSGKLSVSVTLPSGSANCSVKLTGAQRRQTLDGHPTTLLSKRVGDSLSSSFRASSLYYVSGSSVKAYLGVRASCSTGGVITGKSKALTLSTKKRVSRKYRKLSDWLSQAKKKLKRIS